MNNPQVSILCLTYNQESYIRQTLDSFLAQKTNFDFEIIINDDASTDGTVDILREYESKHGDIIRLVLQDENQYSQGARGILIKNILPLARGKYIATCDGDDFFISEDKLQIQFDFMERNPDYAICFHSVKAFTEGNKFGDEVWSIKGDMLKELNWKRLLKANFIPMNSVMYRRIDYSDISRENIMPADWYLHLYHARFGKIGYLDQVMSAYRRHEKGVWWNFEQDKKKFMKDNLRYLINFYLAISSIYDNELVFISMEDLFGKEYKNKMLACRNKMNKALKEQGDLLRQKKQFIQKQKTILNSRESLLKSQRLLLASKDRLIQQNIAGLDRVRAEKERLENSKSFRIGELFFRSIKNPWKWLTFPVNLIRILLSE